ncbi:MAG: HYExAFE family protein [Planctomycetota bacterium]
MAQRRHHYERAFEAYLRTTRTPYISVDEAKRALLPPKPMLSVRTEGPAGTPGPAESLKSFDFVMYTGSPEAVGRPHLLVEVKGRRVGRKGDRVLTTKGRLENWVTRDDITALDRWQALFNAPEARGSTAGRGSFAAAFVFVYWCSIQPPDALFQDVFAFGDRWYAVRMIELDAYAEHMRTRSEKWGTVQMDRSAFERLSRPLSADTRRPLEPASRLSKTPALRRAITEVREAKATQRKSTGEPAVAPPPAARYHQA